MEEGRREGEEKSASRRKGLIKVQVCVKDDEIRGRKRKEL